MKLNELSRDVKSVALAICQGLVGRSDIESMIREERWDDLISVKINPNDYDNAEKYFADVSSVSFLRKYEPLPTKIDRKQVAIDGFFEAERKCYRTNQRLLPFVYNTYCVEDEALAPFFVCLRNEVESLIGPRPPSNPAGRFGPGSTYGDRTQLATVPDKMSSRPTMTREAWPFLFPWSGTLWAKACAARGDSISIVRGNRFTAVPKDCTKNRGICIGPSVNLFFQLGFGSALRNGLKSSGINLNDAQDTHRQVAREASISGKNATIDLHQASDTVCNALVKLALPPAWHEPLQDLRETHTEITVDGVTKVVLLEKFSAMGNGYTFELETVIFLAICMVIMRQKGVTPLPGSNVHVFGDDIIVPSELAKDVIAALRFCGFDCNESKTFVDGPFRESCGGDYFLGTNVRPYFLKKEPSEPQDWIAMANGIRQMGCHNPQSDYRMPYLRRAWFMALDNLPVHIRRLRGPSDLGDIVVHDEFEFWETRTRSSRRYIRCYRPTTYRKVSWDHFYSDVLLAGACYGIGWGDGWITPRDSVTGYKVGWVQRS